MSAQNWSPKLLQQFFVPLTFFGYVKRNSGKFPLCNGQYTKGQVVGISDKVAILQFFGVLEVVELSLKSFKQVKFLKKIPNGGIQFVALDFLSCDQEEFIARSIKSVKYVGEM